MKTRFFLALLALVFVLPAKSQSVEWANRIGDAQTQIADRARIDSQGNLYLSGWFSGTNVDFDPSPTGTFLLSSNGDFDGFVAKYDRDGNFKWAFRFGGAGRDQVLHIALDNAGNFFITGFFRGSGVDFNPGAATFSLSSNGDAGVDPGYGGDIFLAKYDTLGNFSWAFNIGGSSLYDSGVGLSSDHNNDVIVSGYFRENVDFDPGPGTTQLNASGGTAFLAKYTGAGAFLWAFNIGQSQADNSIFDVRVDAQNNIHFAGFFQGNNIDMDPSPAINMISSSGQADIVVAKYSPTGSLIWARSFGGSGWDVGFGLTLDASGSVYVTGTFSSSVIDFDPGPGVANAICNDSGNSFLLKLNQAGTFQFAFGLAGNGFVADYGSCITIDGQGNVLLGGRFDGTMDMDPGPGIANIISAGGADAFFAKYTSAGTYLCAGRIGGPDIEEVYEVLPLGNSFFVSGYFRSANADMDPGPGMLPMSSQGAEDMFFNRYYWDTQTPSGTLSGGVVCPGGTPRLTFNAQSGTPPFTLTINDGTTTVTYNNVQSGIPFAASPLPSSTTTYTLTSIRDANNCSPTVPANSSTTISFQPFTITATGGGAICAGDSVQLTASGASTYVWSPATGLSHPNGAQTKAAPSVTTTYKVIGSTSGGCIDSTTVTVTVLPRPVIAVNPAATTACAGDSVQLSASGAPDFSWSPSSGLSNPGIANPKAAPAVSTVYLVRATAANGCRDSAQVNVVVHPRPPLQVTPSDPSFCPGDSVQLQASGAASYQWIPAAGLNNAAIANPRAAPSATTSYRLVGTSAQGCKDSVSLLVTRNAAPVVTATAGAAVCAGDSVQLQASGGSSYQWSPPAGLSRTNIANPKAAPSGATVYEVVVTGANGCRDSATVTATILPRPTLQISAPAPGICLGDSLQLSASGGVSYQWSPASGLSNADIGNPKASPSATTTYRLLATGGNGCVDSAFYTVAVGGRPQINLQPAYSICRGDSALFTASGGGTYQWSPATGLSNAGIAQPKASPATTTTYRLIVTSPTGCADSAFTTLTVRPAPAVTTSVSGAVCAGDSAQLSASGGTAYQWSPASGLNNPLIAAPRAAPATTTSYRVVVTDAQGCRDSATLLVQVHPRPLIITSGNTALCRSDSVQLLASGGVSYLWTPAAGLSSASVAAPRSSPATTTRYGVRVTTGQGCSDTASLVVTVNEKPQITLTPPRSLCQGDTVQLSASGGQLYQWRPAASLTSAFTATPRAFPSTNTTYTVVVISAAGCRDSAQTTLTVTPRPQVSLGRDTALCSGRNLTLTPQPTSTGTYLWSTGSTGVSIQVNQPGSYWVAIQTAGCAAPVRDTIRVDTLGLPVVSLGADRFLCAFDTLRLGYRGRNIQSVLWSTGSTDSTIVISNAGRYRITARNACGSAQDDLFVEVEECNEDLYFPSGFTPNSDSKNDVFRAAVLPGVRVAQYELMIYNRWGELVFRTTDLRQGWNGTFRGVPQDTNTFVWMARYRKRTGEPEIIRKGTFVLIR